MSRNHHTVDVVLVRTGTGSVPPPLPDGFEDLSIYNLITFRSHQETLDAWTLTELIADYVNYRKTVSPSPQHLIPETDFRLYAVCVHYPDDLARQGVLRSVREGVYDAVFPGVVMVRVIVVQQLPQEEHNAMLHLFSAKEELLRYGKEHYRPRTQEGSTLLFELFRAYQEDPDVAPQLEEFLRQSIGEFLKKRCGEKGLEVLPQKLRDALARQFKGNGSTPKPE